jgi:hypothetical protein
MNYVVLWDTGMKRMVADSDELVAALEGIEAQTVCGLAYAVTIMPECAEALSPFDDDFPGGLQIGVGHPERSFVYWLGDGGGTAVEPGLPSGPDGVRFDYGGQPIFPAPEELRVRAVTAREMAREYVQTGQRPEGVGWELDG